MGTGVFIGGREVMTQSESHEHEDLGIIMRNIEMGSPSDQLTKRWHELSIKRREEFLMTGVGDVLGSLAEMIGKYAD